MDSDSTALDKCLIGWNFSILNNGSCITVVGPVSSTPAQLNPIPSTISEYKLVKEIGRGAMGSIFLARDSLLERNVALKLINSDNFDAEAKTLFLGEARALALVSHPNVVIVHRVGESSDGSPYLVTEFVKGTSLEEVPKPVSWSRAVSLGIGIARGLAAVHRKKVLHRDIKPANVMVTENDEPKLVDFGLAKVLEEQDTSIRSTSTNSTQPRWSRVSKSGEVAGTPLYMAPEALFGKPATVESDIYGVGAVLYELIAGIAPRDTLPEDIPLEGWISNAPKPLEEVTRTSINARFSALIARCLAASPAARFSTAEALADALEALRDEEDAVEAPEGNPYRGLEPFDQEHRGVFFGRDTEIRAVSHRLRNEQFLVVAGDSGVGKSSLCKAGVLPNLTRDALERGRSLRVINLVPGQFPLRALTNALSEIVSPDNFHAATSPAADDAALYRYVVQSLEDTEDLLVFVDQLEELSTSSDSSETEVFALALLRMASGPRVRVLATLRGDFITQIARIGSIGSALAKSLFLLRPMTEDGIRAAIVKPALRKGITFESDELVDELVRASVEMPGGLPLLEFALAELWQDRNSESKTFTRKALGSIGSISGALARHADAVLERLSPNEKRAARRVLLKLTNTNRTRVRRTWKELGGDDPETRVALDALIKGRLIVARNNGGDEAVVEVAHEALLREWQTLRGWLDETREQRQFLQELEEAAELWVRRGKRLEETWTGEALSQALIRVKTWGLDVPDGAREFLHVGLERETRASKRRRMFLGGAAAGLLTLAIVSTIAAIAFAEKEKTLIANQAQMRLAAADMGAFELVLEPFDWSAKDQKRTPATVPATLDWRLHAVDVNDPHAPGVLYGEEDVRRSGRRVETNALREQVEARSGPVFLEVLGRGEGCASSFLYLRRLPGYKERQEAKQIKVVVPSCQATLEDSVEIPAGEFYRARPKSKDSEEWIDTLAYLPSYRIDRTEVTQGAFKHYESMEAITGDAVVKSSYYDQDRPGGERLPIVGLDSFMAANYCRFLGKQLPSIDHWLKAMRGGITLPDGPNPAPKRDTPWVTTTSAHPTNLEGEADGAANLAFVGSFPDDKSPYGVLDMSGNVHEWTRDDVEAPGMKGLRYVLGAAWDISLDRTHWGNMRLARSLLFSIGIRCVIP